MTFDALDAWWWPYVFIALAGWLATDVWRWLGVFAGNRLDETSAVLAWVRAVATALVAAVIAKLIVFPSGTLEASPLALRLAAACAGFAAFLLAGQRIYVGIVVALGVLVGGLWLLPPPVP